MLALVTCSPVVEDQARSIVVESAVETLDIDRMVNDLFGAGTKRFGKRVRDPLRASDPQGIGAAGSQPLLSGHHEVAWRLGDPCLLGGEAVLEPDDRDILRPIPHTLVVANDWDALATNTVEIAIARGHELDPLKRERQVTRKVSHHRLLTSGPCHRNARP